VLRSRLWMAVGPRRAWERLDGGDGEEKVVGPCSYAVEDLSEKSASVDWTVEVEEEEEGLVMVGLWVFILFYFIFLWWFAVDLRWIAVVG
jgi:hypothetical protein